MVFLYGIVIYMNTSTVTTDPDEERTVSSSEFNALQTVIAALQQFPIESQHRIFQAAATFLRIDLPKTAPIVSGSSNRPGHVGSISPRPYSIGSSLSPKEFLLEKQPRTDVERIACLAFYLTHYRDIPTFKTLELSKLNTEAAQPKFSNAANSTNNAVKRGYLVPATKGQRQLSAAGEQFVRALPDRIAAKDAMANVRPRKRTKRQASPKNDVQD